MRSTYAYDTDVVMDDGTTIRTTVTNSGDAVKRFLKEVYKYGQRLIVGLDTEWRVIRRDGRRTNRMAVLQLCVGYRCLLFQIVHADYIPAALRAFLACPDLSFVGVAVDNDVERLYCDCNKLVVANAVDLRYVAAEVLSRPELRNAGLKTLAREVMGVHIDKDRDVTMSKWNQPLSMEQVRYACIDAFVSYEVGRLLLTGQHAGDAATGATIPPYMSFELP
ncbi:hypothetical protein SEVIR_5G261100v4 [Setaria viridis]|uniref:3'-5' exonuclease domain-containing protein n=4 Tax=Setaria TaxID=4554 RepID=K3XPA7_SETIT|nr:Werner syndrome ATP-dependent helicase homolog [Setaria italica]XP_034598338.1 Werner syndrome ATP-dependent helicase homolog [Setaria viridis]RCV26520.1 hypothetical protein SETIT_5G252100v2 [Setaria italica]TKW15789.1 hypothetical protein SEVIR_5G261100v2 [Setaria viridis]